MWDLCGSYNQWVSLDSGTTGTSVQMLPGFSMHLWSLLLSVETSFGLLLQKSNFLPILSTNLENKTLVRKRENPWGSSEVRASMSGTSAGHGLRSARFSSSAPGDPTSDWSSPFLAPDLVLSSSFYLSKLIFKNEFDISHLSIMVAFYSTAYPMQIFFVWRHHLWRILLN